MGPLLLLRCSPTEKWKEYRVEGEMGAGQCGTETLVILLAYQEDADVTHQQTPFLPWNADRNPDALDHAKLLR